MSNESLKGVEWVEGLTVRQTGQQTIDIDGMRTEIENLRAEVRRLRDGIPPAMADFITAYRARLLDEAAERAVRMVRQDGWLPGVQTLDDLAAAVRGEVEK